MLNTSNTINEFDLGLLILNANSTDEIPEENETQYRECDTIGCVWEISKIEEVSSKSLSSLQQQNSENSPGNSSSFTLIGGIVMGNIELIKEITINWMFRLCGVKEFLIGYNHRDALLTFNSVNQTLEFSEKLVERYSFRKDFDERYLKTASSFESELYQALRDNPNFNLKDKLTSTEYQIFVEIGNQIIKRIEGNPDYKIEKTIFFLTRKEIMFKTDPNASDEINCLNAIYFLSLCLLQKAGLDPEFSVTATFQEALSFLPEKEIIEVYDDKIKSKDFLLLTSPSTIPISSSFLTRCRVLADARNEKIIIQSNKAFLEAWKKGNIAYLESEIEGIYNLSTYIDDKEKVERIVNKIETCLADEKTQLGLFNISELIGQNGALAKLKEKGFRVIQCVQEIPKDATRNVGFFYEVKDPNSDEVKGHLLGTVHLADKEMLKLNKKIHKAFDEAKFLMLEVEFNAKTYEKSNKRATKRAEKFNKKVSKIVDKETLGLMEIYCDKALKLLKKHFEAKGGEQITDKQYGELLKPITQNKTAKKYLLIKKMFEDAIFEKAAVLSVRPLLSFSSAPQPLGLDHLLYQKASLKKKEIIGLETAESQMDLLDELENEPLANFKSHLNQETIRLEENSISKLFKIWKKGDETGLLEMDATSFLQIGNELHSRFNPQRNRPMADKIDAHMREDKGLYLAAPGCIHMGGAEGIPALLREKGWIVNQVK